jgi:P pilus assembly chaperone PapD
MAIHMNKHRFVITSILILLTMFNIADTCAGVVIGGTRFIYNEKQKGITVPVRNTNSKPYLINTKITAGEDWILETGKATDVIPFMVTPPLFLLKGKAENVVHIIFTGADLPKDRESLFTLSVASIPSGKVDKNSVQMAVRSSFKLLYRPDGIKGDPQLSYTLLKWRYDGDHLLVENPTPFYVTLVNISVNGKDISGGNVISPFGVRHYDECKHANSCQIKWQSINDYGRILQPVVVDVFNHFYLNRTRSQ